MAHGALILLEGCLGSEVSSGVRSGRGSIESTSAHSASAAAKIVPELRNTHAGGARGAERPRGGSTLQ